VCRLTDLVVVTILRRTAQGAQFANTQIVHFNARQ
jgi:hypothetical protein